MNNLFFRPIHMKTRTLRRQILNIAVEIKSGEFEFTDRIFYEPAGPLSIDYTQSLLINHIPLNIHLNGHAKNHLNGKVNGNSPPAPKKLDFKHALVSKAPAPITSPKIDSSRFFLLLSYFFQSFGYISSVFFSFRLVQQELVDRWLCCAEGQET